MAVQFQIRRDTSVNWGLTNPTLAQGEMGYETNTYKMKIGNGTSDWNTLVYFPTAALTLDAITDPAVNAAVTTLKIDAYSGTVITLTTTGNSQTLQNPTSSLSGKSFLVINNDTSSNSITVNTIVIAPGSAINFVWDGNVWIGIGGGTLDHATLNNLSYATSGHTGFQASLGYTPEDIVNKSINIITDASSDIKYPSVKAVKTYADSLVGGLLDYRGAYDASSNLYPSAGGSGASGTILVGDTWAISVQGILGSGVVHVGDYIISKVDTPGQTASNWDSLNTNISYVPEDSANKVTSISGASTDIQYPSAKLLYDQINLKQNTLTFGIEDTNAVKITVSGVADHDYAKFTATGLEGRSYSEVLSDIGAQVNLGYTPENIANLRTTFQVVPDDTHYISEKLAKDSLDNKENSLGNPDVTGKILSSTTGGVRSWILPSGGVTVHSALTGLDYASAGHTGFEPTIGYTPENIINKITSFQITPDDTHYISEKLAYDQLALKENSGVATSYMATHNSTYTHSDIALNTASRHDAVTLGTANGLSLLTQQLSLGLSASGVPGALSGDDWNTFNNKQEKIWSKTGTEISPYISGDTLKINSISEETLGDGVYVENVFIHQGEIQLDFDKRIVLGTQNTVLPYAWYHLNEGTGTIAYNISGGGRNLNLVNSPVWDTLTPKLGTSAILINASPIGERLENSNNTEFGFNFDTPFSVECWIKPTVLVAAQKVVFSKATALTAGYYVSIIPSATGNIDFMMRDPVTLRYIRKTIGSLNWTSLIDVYSHIAVTYDGSRNLAGMNIYLNNVLQTPTVSTNTLTGGETLITATPFQISGLNGSSTAMTTVEVDEFVVYDTEISVADINNRYNGGAGSETFGNTGDIALIRNNDLSKKVELQFGSGPATQKFSKDGTNESLQVVLSNIATSGTHAIRKNEYDIDLFLKADKSNVLELNNTTAFTPDADYEPATKKYVDDSVGAENLWDRVSTTLYPHTITDSVTLSGILTVNEPIQLGLTPTVGTHGTGGKMFWDAAWKTPACELEDDVTLQIGQETMAYVYNGTGSQLVQGNVVYISGTQDGIPSVSLAKGDTETTSKVLGVITSLTIDDTRYGYCTVRGHVNKIDTSAWNLNDELYLDASIAGALTNIKPNTGSYDTRVARVMLKDAVNGRIFVNMVREYSFSSASAGSAVTMFPDDTTIIASGTQSTYPIKTLSKTPVTTTEDVDSIICTAATSPVLYGTYLNTAAIGKTLIDGGIWSFEIWAGVSSAVNVTSITQGVYRVRPEIGTITTTGTLTTRTATASTGTPFATAKIDVGGTSDSDSYLQTTTGFFRILSRVSDTEITIETPTTYTNQSDVAYSVHKKLFSVNTGEINNTATSPLFAGLQLYTVTSAQPSFTVETTDTLASAFFGVSDGSRTVYFAHNGTARYSHFTTPLIALHNDLAGLQGGTTNEYYHITSAQATVVANTSGTNTGDNTFWSGVTKIGNAVSNDLITGKAGGQTIYGGTLTTENLTIQPNKADTTTGSVIIDAGTQCMNTVTGALQVAGGVGVGGDLYAGHIVAQGAGTPAGLSNVMLQSWDSTDSWVQNNIQNLSNGNSASSDWIATADNGSDTTRFIDMGINSSGFSGVPWTINGPNDGYLYTNSGVLSIGTATAGKDLTFFTGGTLAANERARITSAGKFSIGTSSPTGKFEVFKAESSELIINQVDRDFSGANNWTGTNWTTSGGTLVHTVGSTANAILANVNLTSGSIKAGKRYKIYFTVAGNTAGTIIPKIGSVNGATVSVTMGAGNYMSAITAAVDDTYIAFQPTSTFDGSITNISVIEQGVKFQINEAGDLLLGSSAFVTGNIDFVKEGNAQVFEMSDYYDNNTSNVIRSIKYRGTIASPKAVLDSDTLFNFQMGAYDGTARAANQAGFGSYSSGAWTPTNHGTYIRFTATPLNTITSATVAEYHGDKIYLAKPVGIGAGKSSPTSQIDATTTVNDSTIASKGYALISTFGATTGAVTVAEDGVNFVSYASTNTPTAEVIRIVATVVPTSAGNITFSIRGVSSVVAVSNLTETTVDLLATAINTALNLDTTITTNWTVTVASATVTLTAKVAEAKTGTNSFIDTGSTGCVTTVTVTTTGLSAYDHANIRAMTGSAYNNGSGLITNMSGLVFTGGILGTGNVTNYYGADIGIFGTGGGKFGTIAGLAVRSMNGYHSDASTVSYGIQLFANTNATGASKYGIYIGGISGASTNNYSIYSVSGTNYFGGNVGIGITSPVQKLAINDANTITNSFGNVFIGTTDSQAIDKGGHLALGGVYTSTTQVPFASIAGRKSDATDTSTKGYLSLSTLTSGTLTEKMRIDNLGNIGIGTSTPLTFGSSIGLHLSGMTEGTYPTITLQRNDTIVASTNVYGTIQWYSNDSDHVTGNICSSIESVANGTQSGVYPKADIKISTADGTTDISEKFRFYSDGRIAQGTSASTAVSATFARAMTGATTQYGLYQGATIKSDVTASAYSFISAPLTEAASFALNLMYHYSLLNPTIGSGSSITNQIGYHVPSTMTGATSNYGFYGSLASATNRWNIYMAGTADNYLAGKLGIGSATIPAMALDIEGTASTTGVQATRYTAASAGASPYFNFRRSRGSSASPVVVNQGDNLGLFYFYGWKDEKPDPSGRAAEWVPAAGFGGGVENDAATEHLVKGFIYFKTNTVGDFTSDGAERMRISNAGYLGVNVTAPTALVHIGASSTVRASLCLASGTAPTAPVAGDIWNDSTQACIRSQSSGITKSLSGVIFTQTASATVGNTTTETTMVGTGVGVTLLPANFWVAGKTIRLKMYGHISCTALDTASIRVKVGSVTVASSIGDAFPVTLTNSLFIGELIMTCRTTGATGTIFVQGSTTIYAASSADMTVYGRQIVTTSAVTIDTTATGQLNVTYQWSDARAGNTITSTNSVIEVLN